MRQPWYKRGWVRGTIAVLVVVAAGAAAARFAAPVGRFRPLLEQYFGAAIGRPVHIGALGLRLLPRIHLHASDVRIGNPPGFAAGDVATAAGIDLGVDARALLSGKLVITRIALRGTRLNLLRDARGRPNYLFTLPRRAPLLDRIHEVSLGNVTVTVGSVSQTGQIAPLAVLHGLAVTLRSIQPTLPDWLQRIDVGVALRGAELTTPLLAVPVAIQDGTLLVRNGAGRGTFAATLGALRATGTMTLAVSHSPPLTFAVTIPRLAVGDLAPLMRRGPAAALPATPGPRRQLAQGTISIGELTLAALRAARVSARLALYTDLVEITSYALSAYGGSVQGQAAIGYGPGFPMTATARAQGLDVAQVVRAVAPRAHRLTGVLSADATIATVFGGRPLNALTGAGTFAVANGSFQGPDAKGMLVKVAKALRFAVPSGNVAFTYLGGPFHIADRQVSSDALRMNAPQLTATARGDVGFDETLHLTGTAVVNAQDTVEAPPAGILAKAAQAVGNALRRVTGVTAVEVSFALSGSVAAPNFSMVGGPRFLRGTPAAPPPSGRA